MFFTGWRNPLGDEEEANRNRIDMKINNYYRIILVGLFLCIVNCVQAGGNETGLLPGMSKTSFEKILKRTSENIKKKRRLQTYYNFMEMDNMKNYRMPRKGC